MRPASSVARSTADLVLPRARSLAASARWPALLAMVAVVVVGAAIAARRAR